MNVLKRAVLPLALIVVVALAIVFGRDKPPSKTGTGDASDASAQADADTPRALFRYDCAGIAPVSGACAPSAMNERPTDALVVFSEKLAELAALHAPPAADWWAPAEAALDKAIAANLDPKSMTLAERISVQNAAMNLAVAARGARVRTKLPTDAMKLADRLAFSADEQKQVAALVVDLSPWLGPPAERIERTKLVPFFHETVAHHTRVVRLVRTPRLRANFSELIAIGPGGAPFVTPIIGSMEIRRGTGVDAPACVVLQSPERVRCELFAGLVEVRDLTKLPQSHFLRRDEHGDLRCNDCHGVSGNEPVIGAIDLAPEAVAAELDKHRQATLDRLRPLLEPLRP